MASLSPLAREIRDLLVEADMVSLITDLEVEKAKSLADRLKRCADGARTAGFPFSESVLRRKADSIKNRLRNRNL
jgi:hypothetical protein